ncbi:hypothetical protein [Neptuniibacter sp.]|uniref:hypothetical protein n=1 Tax=Neptuniibacter sp. TaxID=1962643 RepID=UPI002637049F|nr:hypothetical protein [Neptuniibacter sp.]MCP4594933.1 hypothetical protein [Neptuniibacter sp.]
MIAFQTAQQYQAIRGGGTYSGFFGSDGRLFKGEVGGLSSGTESKLKRPDEEGLKELVAKGL